MLLDIRDVTKRYRSGTLANDEVTLGVEAGEVFGLLGPNGAGKTTLVSQIVGLLRPDRGTITIDGHDAIARPDVARRLCSFQPQTAAPVTGVTPREAIELIGQIRGGSRTVVRARAQLLLEAMDILDVADRLAPLSGGLARLTGFGMAAVAPGRVVILDEPTNDVDPLRRRALWAQVRALADGGAAVLLVTHNVLEAERCVDRLAIVAGGRVLAQGTPAELKARMGAPLRLECVLDPGAPTIPPPRGVATGVTTVGRRLLAQVQLADVGRAVAWAKELQDAGSVAEFSVGPASLEDVYARWVQDEPTQEEQEVVGA